jgi:hypothetical protein
MGTLPSVFYCEQCSAPVTVQPSRLRKGPRFCSRRCQTLATMRLLPERFWEKVPLGDGCREWADARNRKGYGVANLPGQRTAPAHRVAWELANGRPVPAGLCVCHTCDNPPCCNPAHLFLGTRADNNADMYAKGRGGHGWVPGEKCGTARLTAAQVSEIRHRYASGGLSHRALAREYGVHYRQIGRIVRGLSWKHLEHGV